MSVKLTKGGGTREIKGRNLIVAVGSRSTVPDLPGLDQIKPWTNREATSTRHLPRSLAILGGGPTGLEMAQVFARYGVPVTLIQSPMRLNDRDHPRSSDAIAEGSARGRSRASPRRPCRKRRARAPARTARTSSSSPTAPPSRVTS